MAIKINGTNTAANPSITGDDTDTGIVYGSDQIDFSTGGSSKVTLNGSNLGIGIQSPQEILHVKGASETISSRDGVIFGSTDSLAADKGLPLVWTAHIGTDANYGIASICGRKENATNDNGAGYLQFGTGSSGGAIDERLRIDSSGNLLVGTSSTSAIQKFGGSASGLAVKAGQAVLAVEASANSQYVGYLGQSGTDTFLGGVGGGSLIFQTGTSGTSHMRIDSSGNIGAPSGTNIFNASDSRVKTNVVDLDKGLSAIKSLRPVSFNWIDGFCDEEKDTLYGFIAQEVKAVDNNLIQDFATELTINDNKIENVLRVNEKFIIPMLVKALQEAVAKIEVLETKVAALEAA